MSSASDWYCSRCTCRRAGGVEVLHRMREIAGAVPVAVLLGKDEQHLADEVCALGAVATYG